MDGVEVRHLRVLVAVAEQGTLTGAAAVLGLGQPAVSRTLAQLERRVGVHLVRRTTRSLRLTDAGEGFRQAAVRALAALDGAVAAARGSAAPLRLGFSWAAAGRHTLPILLDWRRAHPDRPVVVHRHDDRTAGLADDRADLALVRVRPAGAGYAYAELFREPRLLAVAEADPLAALAEVHLADLAGRALAVVSAYGTTRLSLWPAAYRPTITVDARNIDDWLAVVGSGEALGVTPESTAHQYPLPGIRYVPLVDAPPIVTRFAWHRDRVHPWRAAFVAAAREVVAGRRVAPAPSGSQTGRVSCDHLAHVPDPLPPPGTPQGCTDCLATGSTWVHLRRCEQCGHIGCCDSSPMRHATAHFHATTHPVIRSFEPGESWRWCYVDAETADGAGA